MARVNRITNECKGIKLQMNRKNEEIKLGNEAFREQRNVCTKNTETNMPVNKQS